MIKKLFLLSSVSLILSGCSLIPSAWKSARPPAGEPPAAPTIVGPTQTVEELDAAVSADLETSLDADLKQIDQDLKTIDAEAQNY